MNNYTITLSARLAEKFDKILQDEGLTASEWLGNAVEDYDS
jgi:metal-responsive CopG/Arc/MetJ family transcriptional regulator